MASTRSTTARRDAARAEPPKAALTALARRTVRVQIAACTAAVRTLTGWAQATDRFAQTAGDELRRVDGDSDSPELIARLTTAASSHLRDLAMLPRAAADLFDARLARAPIDN